MKIERSVFLCAFFVVGMLTVEGESFGNLIPYGKKILYKRKVCIYRLKILHPSKLWNFFLISSVVSIFQTDLGFKKEMKFLIRTGVSIHSLVHPFVLSFVLSFSRSLARSLARSLVRSFARSLVRSLVRSFVRSSVRTFVRALVRACVRSFVCLFVHLIGRTVAHSVGQSVLCLFVRSFISL